MLHANPPNIHQNLNFVPPNIHQNPPKNNEFEDDNDKNNIKNNLNNDVLGCGNNKYCISCKKIFSRSDVLKKHLECCKIRKADEKSKKEIYIMLLTQQTQINTLIQENSKLSNLVVKLTDNGSQTLTNVQNTLDSNNTNTNTNTNTNNGSIATNNGSIATNNGNITTNNNIKIEFGKEDLSKISNEFFIKTLVNNSGASIPSKIIEGIHFNPEFKEFMNVFITDISRNKAMVFDGKTWNIANADEVVNTLFDRATHFCEDKHEELQEKIEKIEKNNKIKSKIKKEMYVMDIMVNYEPYDYNEYNQPIDIDGNILKNSELKRGKCLNTKSKEHIKNNLYNKKEIVQNIK